MKIFKKQETQKDLRKNVYLPVIEDQKEMQKFAKKLTKVIISLFGTGGEHDEYRKQETEMLYHAIVLLMAYPKKQHLKAAIHCYLNPEFVKRRMEFLTIKDTYEYWRLEVPKFMKQQNDIANLLRHFYINVALVIGEDEVQDLCKSYGDER